MSVRANCVYMHLGPWLVEKEKVVPISLFSFFSISIKKKLKDSRNTLWTLCFQCQAIEAERGLVRPQNRHFLTQKPYGLPFLLVTFFNWTHRFRVIN